MKELGSFAFIRRLTRVGEALKEVKVAEADGDNGIEVEVADSGSALKKEEGEMTPVAAGTRQ